MIRRILAAAFTLTALTGGAFAADFGRAPVLVAPPPPVPYVVPGWNGFYVGGHAGYGWGKARDSAVIELTIGPFSRNVYSLESTVNWMARAVGKLGFALTSNAMIYVDGGLALANFGLTSSAGYSDNTTGAGWTVGAGAEMKVS